MLDDKTCEEIAAIIISFAEQLPKEFVPDDVKKRMGASHSLLTSGIIGARKEWEEALGRLHYFLELKEIKIIEPPAEIKEQENAEHKDE